tara:strand:+ start:513 stop:659 length:147 start_codon:yes stop_codon:yes gene_type:complete
MASRLTSPIYKKIAADLLRLGTEFMITKNQFFDALIGAEAVAKTTAAI